MTELERWVVSVLGEIDATESSDFAGLGLLFYTNRESLPVHPLLPSDSGLPLPTKNCHEAIRLLARISRRSSEFHDGFHLVDAESLSVTDVSQFLSPPIPSEPLMVQRAVGARHMAARLASLLPGVELVAVYAIEGRATVYKSGQAKVIRIGAPQNR